MTKASVVLICHTRYMIDRTSITDQVLTFENNQYQCFWVYRDTQERVEACWIYNGYAQQAYLQGGNGGFRIPGIPWIPIGFPWDSHGIPWISTDSESLWFLFHIFIFYFWRRTLYLRAFTVPQRSSDTRSFSEKNNVVFTKSLDKSCHKISIEANDAKKLFYFSSSYL